MFAQRVLVAAVICVSACAEPFYDDDIGVAGVATEPGALAGFWALKQRYVSVGYVPVLGYEVENAGDEFFLIRREWDAATQSYSESWRFCIDENGESAGLTMVTPQATLDSIDLRPTEPDIDAPSGSFKRSNALQLWALQNLPDLFNTPVPTPENYQQSPQKDWIYDADNDGHVGCTTLLTGIVTGEGYYINRKITQYRGVVVSADHVFGLVEQSSAWSTLESTVSFAVQTGSIPSDKAHQHEDPKRSWFDEIRVEGDNCQSVIDARDTQKLARIRPF